jgi:4-oxalocrotonate tautomerase
LPVPHALQQEVKMPIVTINILEGRSKEQKKELIKNVSAAVSETIAAPPETIRVIINEMPYDNYGLAGLPIKEYRASKESKK